MLPMPTPWTQGVAVQFRARQGKRNGQGTLTFADGTKYVGEFKDNERSGQGTETYASGTKYVGQFKEGKRSGQGTHTFANGDKYVGEFLDGKQSGQGTLTLANGDKYVGEFKDYLFSGLGTHTFADGEKYVGEFLDGDRSGKGTVLFRSGSKFVGEFKNNKANGQGIMMFADGNRYVGEYKDDKFSGQGTFTHADGTKYVGEFRNNEFNGLGTGYASNGSIVRSGFWENNKFVKSVYVPPQQPRVAETPEVPEKSSGTGFYVSADGHLITNYHVVDGCIKLKAVALDGSMEPLRVLRSSKVDDLALLKANTKSNSFASFRNSRRLTQGETVVAYGYPLPAFIASSGNVSAGLITALAGTGDNANQMQISAQMQPGSSGGPIVDVTGAVVGVGVSILVGTVPQNVNFAIKGSAVINLLDASNVRYTIASSTLELSLTENTEQLKAYTVKIECN